EGRDVAPEAAGGARGRRLLGPASGRDRHREGRQLSGRQPHRRLSPISLAGTPPTTAPGGTSLVTTLPAATVAARPMWTPFRTITPAPSQTRSSSTTGLDSGRVRGSPGTWKSLSTIITRGPIWQRDPILTSSPAQMDTAALMKVPSPISSL